MVHRQLAAGLLQALGDPGVPAERERGFPFRDGVGDVFLLVVDGPQEIVERRVPRIAQEPLLKLGPGVEILSLLEVGDREADQRRQTPGIEGQGLAKEALRACMVLLPFPACPQHRLAQGDFPRIRFPPPRLHPEVLLERVESLLEFGIGHRLRDAGGRRQDRRRGTGRRTTGRRRGGRRGDGRRRRRGGSGGRRPLRRRSGLDIQDERSRDGDASSRDLENDLVSLVAPALDLETPPIFEMEDIGVQSAAGEHRSQNPGGPPSRHRWSAGAIFAKLTTTGLPPSCKKKPGTELLAVRASSRVG